MHVLVSTEWLAGELGKPDLVVFDCSTYLPNEPGNARDEFRKAHIPGARLFDIDEIADPDTDLPHMIPTPGRFAKLVGALGVSNATRVVFYDQHGLRTEPSGAITVAALLSGEADLSGDGDIVAVVSGRNVDESAFRNWLGEAASP